MSSLTEQFVKEVEKRILTGEWETGKKIPPLRALADEFHVSRSVINAGIAELSTHGYLTTVPRKYICVSDWRKTGNFSVLTGLLQNGLCDESFFNDLLDGRMTIEKAIAVSAAKNRTEEDIAALEKCIDTEKKCVTPSESAKADDDFHHTLATAAHNVVYSVILNSFSTISDKLILEFYQKTPDKEYVIATHEKLCKAIRQANDVEAEKLMESLLKHGEKEIKKPV